MLLHTIPFLVFFIFVCILYWSVPQKYQWILLLIAGYYFFGFWEPAYTGLIFLTTAISYFAAGNISHPKRKKVFFALAILLDVSVLFIFKYFNFFALNLTQLLGVFHLSFTVPQFRLLLPVGISFYTFTTVGYLLDVYRGKIKPEKHFGYFALFVCFFPALSAGPIERASELLPQLKRGHRFDYHQAVSGIELFMFGLFKKMVIADNLGILVDRVFSSLDTYKGLSLVLAVVAFSWQIYADFSGYTDMARGVARILGFDLVENFNFPYLATSLRDFWKRWHMSLTRWFMDYVYVPLGGNKQGLVRTCINGVIVFTLSGLWHGASWNFVVWGLFHGIVMALERIAKTIFGGKITVPPAIGRIYAYTVVCISWVIFRTSSLDQAAYIFRYAFVGIKNILSLNYLTATFNQLFALNSPEAIIISLLFFTVVSVEALAKAVPLGLFVRKQPLIVRYAIYTFLVFAAIHLRNAEIKQFFYARF